MGSNSADLIRRCGDALLAILLAPACASCSEPLDTPTNGAVCDRCWSRIVPFVDPSAELPGDIRLRAIGPYEGTLRSIVHALKYDGRRSLASPLAARMRSSAGDLLAGAHLAVPVPLHRARRRSRGFNQAEDLARHLGLPVANVLRRQRATLSQADLPASRRQGNVRGAFGLRRGASVDGLCVVLVDDVTTTGATLEACARALKEAGTREVRAVTAARAVSRLR